MNIAFEGIDGAGKSTQVGILVSKLQDQGLPIIRYNYTNKENKWGRIIKKWYAHSNQKFNYLKRSRYIQEVLYGLSARANFRNIENQINSDTVVISDRSIVTAYASHMSELPRSFVELVELKFIPDLVIYLDISPEEAMKRLQNREVLFKDESLEELTFFRSCYDHIINKKRPKGMKETTFVTLDANKTKEELSDLVYKIAKDGIKGSNNGRKI